jgi:uncharacterized protein YdhG (YjbR/CyaY superfamily)
VPPSPSSRRKTDAESSEKLRGYFAALPPATRKRLKEVRAIIRSIVPEGGEKISYGIPAITLDGRVLIYYAAWKAHTSLYPMTAEIRRAHADALEGYEMSKGTIRFPLDEPLPAALVKRLVKARLAEHRALRRKATS